MFLAKSRIRRGFKAPFDVRQFPVKLEQAEVDLLIGMLPDINARNQLIFGHIHLAMSIVAKYIIHFPKKTSDLVSEALLGLVYAVSVASNKSTNIRAYIETHIYKRLAKFVGEDRNVHIPMTTYQRHQGRRKIKNTHLAEFVAKETKVSLEFIDALDKSILDDVDKKIVMMRIEGYTDQEIGDKLGYSERWINMKRGQIGDRFHQLYGD